MTFKDLSAHLTPDLELPWKGRTFVVPPPSKEDGLVLTALNAVGIQAFMLTQGACPTCHRSGPMEMDERTMSVVELVRDRDLGEFSLGPAYAEMIEAGVPGPDLEMFELYAMYFWTMGEETADAILQARTKHRGAPAPKARAPRKNGRPSE